jgi:uncharacterized integral membrane protein
LLVALSLLKLHCAAAAPVATSTQVHAALAPSQVCLCAQPRPQFILAAWCTWCILIVLLLLLLLLLLLRQQEQNNVLRVYN